MASRGLMVGSFTALMIFMLSFCAANGLTCYECVYDTRLTPGGKNVCNATLEVCDEQNNETYCVEDFRKRIDSEVFKKGCARAENCVDTRVCEDATKSGGYIECSRKCCQGDRCNSAFVTTTSSAFVTTTNSAFVTTTNSAFVTTTNSAFVTTTNSAFVTTTNSAFVTTTNSAFVTTTNSTFVTTTNSAFMTTTTSTTMLVFGLALVFFSLL